MNKSVVGLLLFKLMLKRMGQFFIFVLVALSALSLQAQSVHPSTIPDPEMPADDYQKNLRVVTTASRNTAITTLSVTQAATIATDSMALVDLYNSTNGAQWTIKTNWLTGRLSTWYGVTVSGGRVTRLTLTGNNLTGTIPESIGNLDQVDWLRLYENKLTGTIPSSIGNMMGLTRLMLYQNQLTGAIPSSIGNLTGLNMIMVHENQLSGPIPSSIGNLVNLTYLYLYTNQLTGDLPSSMGNLVNLQLLAFHRNNLTGNFDWIGNLINLTSFYYYANPNMVCTLPASIGNLTKMTFLAGGGWTPDGEIHTKIYGPIPATLGNCVALQSIYLDNSEFSGDLPSTFNQLVNLKVIWMQNNPALTGDISTLLNGLTKLENIYISNSGFNGTIPSFIGTFTNLNYFNISGTRITGPLPASMANLTNLTILNLERLELDSIPNWVKDLTKLISLKIGTNRLNQIPDLTTHINKANLEYSVDNNVLDFKDFESHFTGAGVSSYKTFTYSPQANLGTAQRLIWKAGGNDSLRLSTPGQFNLYQWQKNSAGDWRDLPGENQDYLYKNYILPSDSGQYRLKVTNEKATDLSLYSSVFTVQVSDSTINQSANVIPKALRVTRDGRRIKESINHQKRLNLLNEGDTVQVFQGCIDGDYYLAVQLVYDLGDRTTIIPWSADLAVTLIRAQDSLWTKTLKASMIDQTFLSTVFEDSLISCTDDYRIVITRKNVTSNAPQDNLYLKFLLYKKPTDVFNPSASVLLNCNYTTQHHATTLSWTSAGSSILEYDVEWVFIEEHENFSGSTALQAFDFKEPVRVTTDSLHYTHLVYYPDGKLWYRIRAVGFNPQYPGHRIPGQWFYTPCGEIAIANHEPQKNWQEQTVFAEEGKYKKVMHYFDGSLRQRQSQTNLNTENVTLVAESLYDFEGRQSASVLAVPALDQLLTFKPGFNAFTAIDSEVGTRTSSTRQKFHYDNKYSQNSIVSDESGAGNYYSGQNNRAQLHRDYIPDASGFVYSQTEYVNDGTGRVARQSGVGDEFKMDGDHTTRFYYGNVAPAEIIRLFGSNVGKASHYKKNLVVDPNGQVSVSYMDQEDRVIATALAGESPDNVKALESYTNLPTELVTVDLTDKNIKQDGSSTISHKILNTSPNTNYTFEYDLFALASYVERTGCVACGFDLSFTITGPEGDLVELPAIPGNDSGNTNIYTRKNITAASCSVPELASIEFTISLMEIGDYTVTKILQAKELSFSDMETIVKLDSSFTSKIEEIKSDYTVDPSECEICNTQACLDADSVIDDTINEIALLDCENIYSQIVQHFKDQYPDSASYVPSDSLIATHENYCQYTLCSKNKNSDVFEKQLARLSGWQAAFTGGFTNYTTLVNSTDPFFTSTLSGYNFKQQMLDRLGNIVLTPAMAGTLTEVTDPEDRDFYIDAVGNPDPVNGKHILYVDLMGRKNSLSAEEYADELDKQRWVLFRSFYIEEKRHVKILTEYKDCPAALADLQSTGHLQTLDTEEEINDWASENQMPPTVSDEEVAGSYYSVQSTCDAIISKQDSTSISSHLEAYFNSNPSNFFRLILTEDLTSNQDLLQIKTILNTYGCALDSVALNNPIVCVRDTVISTPAAQTMQLTQAQGLAKNENSLAERPKAAPAISQEEQAKADARMQAIKNELIQNVTSGPNEASQKSVSAMALPVSQLAAPLPSQAEYNALRDLYINMGGATRWTNKTNWNPVAGPPQSVENWYGIVVDPNTGGVVEINLAGNNLSGTLPASIGNLVNLKALRLGTFDNGSGGSTYNNINGSIPSTIGNLVNLEVLDLNRAQNLVSPIPATMSALTKLKVLDLRGSRFTGTVPAYVTTDFPDLEVLDFSSNYSMSGPFPTSLSGLSKLKYLNLSDIQFSGSIPASLSALTSVENIFINASWQDNLTGPIPAGLSQLTNLRNFEIRGHRLTGPIPDLSLLQSLERIDLSSNELTGSIPNVSSNALHRMNLSYNQLTGNIPASIGNLPNLNYLLLGVNGLTGSIPASLSQLSQLNSLDLSYNALENEVPAALGDLNNLSFLGLANNQLFGSLPTSLIDDGSSLYNLTIENNRFTFENFLPLVDYSWDNSCGGGDEGGPCFTYAPQDSVDVKRSHIVAQGQSLTLTTDIDRNTSPDSHYQWFKYVDGVNDFPLMTQPSTESYELKLFNLALDDAGSYYYQITNDDPQGLILVSRLQTVNVTASCTPNLAAERAALEALYAATNGAEWTNNTNWLQANQPVGNWFGVDTNAGGYVTSIYLSNNGLEGTLASALKNLCMLEELELANNALVGAFPDLGVMTELRYLNLSSNNFTGEIPALLLENNLPNLSSLYLSNNKFSGDLQPAFGSRWVYSLVIENNRFTFSNILEVIQTLTSQGEPTMSYAPQDTIDIKRTYTVAQGETLTLTTDIDRNTAPDSYYQWFRNGIELAPRATNGHTLVLSSIAAAHAGDYYYQITNDDAADLTLISHIQKVIVQGDSSLTSICLEYDTANSTLALFNYEVDWDKVVATCIANAAKEDSVLVDFAIEKLIEEEATTFYFNYVTNCLDNANDSLRYIYQPKEYHYTLYYYDQAASLVQTVPPNGVHPLNNEQVKAFMRGNKTEPPHTFITRYLYNSLNQLAWQKTPDAGKSNFWYNDKGQLKLSQNAQQRRDDHYSYTKYDEQGRISEVGEITTALQLSYLQGQLELLDFPSSGNSGLQLSDITRTHYDLPAGALVQNAFTQQNLRTRVAWVEVMEKDRPDTVATYYSYDIHGNVKSLLQRIPGLDNKRTDYVYDLISGKVNYVMYQYDEADEFIHYYTYDADNRITDVQTSSDAYLWDREARYFYYLHGPLARVELGEYRVQGLDYYYTLQGWIKGVNMPYANDPGNDGNDNSPVGRDAYAFVLGYYQGDYQPVNPSVTLSDNRDQLWTRYQQNYSNDGLFNGNIGWMTTDLKKIGQEKGQRAKGMQAMIYQYDQLNRIVQSNSLTNYVQGSGFAGRSGSPEAYDENYTYDPNGNILTLQRRDDQAAMADDFHYDYYNRTNKLKFLNPIVRDTTYAGGAVIGNNKVYRNIKVQGNSYVPTGRNVQLRATDNIDITDDFDVQDNANFHGYILTDDEGSYVYDAIGNLIWNQDEGVKIEWTPYGKVREVRTKGDSVKVQFRYDATGNRVEKRVSKTDTVYVTRYLRDASGNVMGIYKGALLTEQPLYGSSRLGMYRGGREDGQRKLGMRNFELSNHLGNVLTIVTDNVGMNHAADSAWTSVVSASDYYPFGLEMKGRTGIWAAENISADSTLLNSDFNSNSYSPFYIEGSGVLSVESGRLKISNANLYSHAYVILKTVKDHQYSVTFDVDLSGGGSIVAFCSDRTYNLTQINVPANGTYTYTFKATTNETIVLFENGVVGPRNFYLDNVVIKDLTGPVNNGEPIAGAYRYGFNGKEKDGNGEFESIIYDYGFRIYDPRIGKFLSVDPLTSSYPSWSPYPFAMNRPIDGIDMDGLEYVSVNNSGVNPDEHLNDDGSYSFSLGNQKFVNVQKVNLGGEEYFDVGRDLFYGDSGWSGQEDLTTSKMTVDIGAADYLFSSSRIDQMETLTTNFSLTTDTKILPTGSTGWCLDWLQEACSSLYGGKKRDYGYSISEAMSTLSLNGHATSMTPNLSSLLFPSDANGQVIRGSGKDVNNRPTATHYAPGLDKTLINQVGGSPGLFLFALSPANGYHCTFVVMDSRDVKNVTFKILHNHGVFPKADVDKSFSNMTTGAAKYYSRQGKDFNMGTAAWILKE